MLKLNISPKSPRIKLSNDTLSERKCWEVFAYESETFHRRRPNGISLCENGERKPPKPPLPLLRRGPHLIQQCLGPPHAPPQTAAQTVEALSHTYAVKSPLVTMARLKFAPKVPLPVDRSPNPATCLIPGPVRYMMPTDARTYGPTDRRIVHGKVWRLYAAALRERRGLIIIIIIIVTTIITFLMIWSPALSLLQVSLSLKTPGFVQIRWPHTCSLVERQSAMLGCPLADSSVQPPESKARPHTSRDCRFPPEWEVRWSWWSLYFWTDRHWHTRRTQHISSPAPVWPR